MSIDRPEIYVIRSAASYGLPGEVGQASRPLGEIGHGEKAALGAHLLDIIGQHPAEVRFAPATRTRMTALGVIGLSYSSIPMQRDPDLTEVDHDKVRAYLERIAQDSPSPSVLFTHLDVIQSMVYAVTGKELTEDDIPTASVTRFLGDELELDYVGHKLDADGQLVSP